MAAILSIDYTPYYNGCHRICFRSTELEWCCYLDESPSVLGTSKTVSINLSQDYAQCLVTVPTEIGCNGGTAITGYIQACCVDANSEVDRIPFNVNFPQDECTAYSIACLESGIAEITRNNIGYGWPIGVTPTITIIDANGLGIDFEASVTMGCLPGDNFCSLDEITIDNPGQNYYYIDDLTVDVFPLPSCISNELITNGDFSDGLNGWTATPTGLVPEAWTITGAFYAKYNIEQYGATQPGTISQNILTPGKTYDISFELTIGVNNGDAYVVVSAGTLDPSGTQPNQYLHTQTVGPLFTGIISTTLTCVGTNEFSIYIYSDVAEDIASRAQITGVSVIEICTPINPDLEVTEIDKCGTFTVPGCGETPNPTIYEIWGGSASINTINVCSPDPGPTGDKYNIQPEPGLSCCACKLYNVVVRNPIDIYYTDCYQTVDIISVEAGAIGVTICAIENSVWPANPQENAEILAITEVGDCTPTD
jgi:hypothetical protein